MGRSCLLSVRVRLAGLALLMAAAPALPQGQEQQRLGPAEREWLEQHNMARADVGLGPLRWDRALVSHAQGWASSLAARGALQHDPKVRARRQGENLWRGTRSAFAPRQMIGMFIAEKRHFHPGTFPQVSRTGDWSDVGHYTQIIWPETEAVGCAIAASQYDEVLVCRYWPAGNVMGYRLDPAQRLARR